MANFDHAVQLLLGDPANENDGMEGGYINDPNDPGGETKFGISKRSYPDLDIKNLNEAEARAIYHRDFWDVVRGDEIRNQLAADLLFDTAIHCGQKKAIRMAQEVVGAKVDGVFGPITLDSVNNTHDFVPWMVLRRFRHNQDVIARNQAQKSKLYGWTNRLLKFVEV